MSTVYTDNYNAAINTSPGKLIDSVNWGGELRVYFDTYEAVALATASTIYFFRPPKGYKIIGGFISCDDLGTGNTVEVGIVGTTAKFLAATDVSTAAAKTALLPIAAIAAEGYEFDGETDIIVTTAGAQPATGTINLCCQFLARH